MAAYANLSKNITGNGQKVVLYTFRMTVYLNKATPYRLKSSWVNIFVGKYFPSRSKFSSVIT